MKYLKGENNYTVTYEKGYEIEIVHIRFKGYYALFDWNGKEYKSYKCNRYGIIKNTNKIYIIKPVYSFREEKYRTLMLRNLHIVNIK